MSGASTSLAGQHLAQVNLLKRELKAQEGRIVALEAEVRRLAEVIFQVDLKVISLEIGPEGPPVPPASSSATRPVPS